MYLRGIFIFENQPDVINNSEFKKFHATISEAYIFCNMGLLCRSLETGDTASVPAGNLDATSGALVPQGSNKPITLSLCGCAYFDSSAEDTHERHSRRHSTLERSQRREARGEQTRALTDPSVDHFVRSEKKDIRSEG